MKYGHFSDNFKEYVVTRPDTIRPWQNFMGNKDYGLVLSQCGSGFSIAGNTKHTQVSYYTQRNDQSGRYVYIHDNDTKDFWALGWQPVRKPVDSFACRHGKGYSIISSQQQNIESEMRVFVPADDPVEIWTIKIKNTGDKVRNLTMFPFIEWVLDNARVNADDLAYAARTESSYDKKTHSIMALVRTNMYRPPNRAFMTADFEPSGYDCRRSDFVGPGRTLADPISVINGACSNQDAYYEIAVGVLSKAFVLEPGAEQEFQIIVGMQEDGAGVDEYRKKYFADNNIEKAFSELAEFWDDMGARFSIETPDPQFNGMFNHWITRHVYTLAVSNTIRCFNKGFRNCLQDTMGVLPLFPQGGRATIVRAGAALKSDGQPPWGWSVENDKDRPSSKTDLKFWLVLAACYYIRETGDFDILKEVSPFSDCTKETTLLEKLNLIIDKGTTEIGAHGLCLVGAGDWNDTLNLWGIQGRGESVWTSMFLVVVLTEMSNLLAAMDDKTQSLKFKKHADSLKESINKNAWDGEWYLMGFDDDGNKVGSSENVEGRIYAIVQAWAVLSGVATSERQQTMFAALKKMTLTKYGYAIMDKPYTEKNASLGGIAFVGQGMNENASIYSHVEAFLVYAQGLAGMGNDSYETLQMLMPYNHDADVTQATDFALPNFYRGPAYASKFGCIHRNYTTSTPNWVVMAMSDTMMGVQISYDGFTISPCLPAKWDHCVFRRNLRGVQYEITIENPDHLEQGVKDVVVDGVSYKTNKIPFSDNKKTVKITVIMG